MATDQLEKLAPGWRRARGFADTADLQITAGVDARVTRAHSRQNYVLLILGIRRATLAATSLSEATVEATPLVHAWAQGLPGKVAAACGAEGEE